MISNKDYYTAQELADAVGVTVQTIRNKCRSREIKNASKKFGRDWVVPAADALDWILKQRDNKL